MSSLIFLLHLVFPQFALAQVINPYQARPECLTPQNAGKIKTLKTIPPVKDQDGIGLCYAFSSALILEQLNCRVNGSNCRSPETRISVLDIAKRGENNRRIVETGAAYAVLANFEITNGKTKTEDFSVVREQCAPYSRLQPIEKVEEDVDQLCQSGGKENQALTPSRMSQGEGWANLRKLFLASRNTTSPTHWSLCKAKISNSLPDLKRSIENVHFKLAKSTANFEEFASQVLIPDECQTPDKKLNLPPFTLHSFPEEGGVNADLVWRRSEELVAQNVMHELGICTNMDPKKGCTAAHSLTVIGTGQCCDESGKCRRAFQIQNSYGANWQEGQSQGWLDAESLLDAAFKLGEKQKLVWLQAKSEELKFQVQELSSKQKRTRDIRNQPIAPTVPAPKPMTNPAPKAKPGTIYRCTLPNGKTEYSDQDLGNCRPLN